MKRPPGWHRGWHRLACVGYNPRRNPNPGPAAPYANPPRGESEKPRLHPHPNSALDTLSAGPKAAQSLALAILCAGTLGMSCTEKQDPPSLPSAILTDVRLQIADPAQGNPGVLLAWDYPAGANASYFELYQAFSLDSLKHSAQSQPATDPHTAILPLPDISRPFTVYFAVRAVWVEPTGQKLVSDTLVADSITVAPSLNILKPGTGTYQGGRVMSMEVQTNSDPGVMLRMAYYEKEQKEPKAWVIKQDTCLPLDRCDRPIFGPSLQRDSLILEQHADSDTVAALFCVIGTESFQEQRTGLTQSLGCSRFFRVNP